MESLVSKEIKGRVEDSRAVSVVRFCSIRALPPQLQHG